MKRMEAAARHHAMQAFGLRFMGSALRLADFLFQAPKIRPTAQAIGVTGDRGVLKPEVNSDVRL